MWAASACAARSPRASARYASAARNRGLRRRGRRATPRVAVSSNVRQSGSSTSASVASRKRLIGRAPLEVVRSSLLREVEKLVVVTRAERMLREPRDVGAFRLAQRSEGSLVQSAAFATEELILDRVSHERMAEHELVRTVSGDEAAIDEPAEVTDHLLLVHAGDRCEHVERRSPAEHRGGIDHAPLVAAQPVELTTDDLRERERQRLRGETVGVRVACCTQDLLEEERVSASAGVERGRGPRRERSSVDAREEVRDLRLRSSRSSQR